MAASESGTPFNVLMQQAASLKTAQLALDRQKFDSFDKWYQDSLFSQEDICEQRLHTQDSLEERLEFAEACKKRGNDAFRASDFSEAIHEYTRSLAMFNWIESTESDWKKKAIEDKHIVEHAFTAGDGDEEEKIKAFKATCLVNLGTAYLYMKDWNHCIAACTKALEIDPKNPKALYRRAQARHTPPSAGTVESKIALRDLRDALCLAPTNKTIRKAFDELRLTLINQRFRDKATFNNMFDRRLGGEESDDGNDKEGGKVESGGGGGGKLVHKKKQPSSSAPGSENELGTMTLDDAYAILKDMESACRVYAEDGDKVMFAHTKARIEEIQAMLDEHEQHREAEQQKQQQQQKHATPLDAMDFLNPTPQMIEEAKLQGIDLTDIKVQRLMHELESARRADVRAGVLASGGDNVDAYMSVAMQNIWHEESRSIAEHLLKSWKEDMQFKALESRISYSDSFSSSSSSSSSCTGVSDESESTQSAAPITAAVAGAGAAGAAGAAASEPNSSVTRGRKVEEVDSANDSGSSSGCRSGRGSDATVSAEKAEYKPTPAEVALDVYRREREKSGGSITSITATFRTERLLEVLTEDIFEIYLVGFAKTADEEYKSREAPGDEEIDSDIKRKQEQLALMLSDRYGVHYDGYNLPNKPLEVAGASFFSSRAVLTVVVGFLAFLLMQYSGIYS